MLRSSLLYMNQDKYFNQISHLGIDLKKHINKYFLMYKGWFGLQTIVFHIPKIYGYNFEVLFSDVVSSIIKK